LEHYKNKNLSILLDLSTVGIDDIESADDSLPVNTAQGAGNDDDPSLPKHEDQGAATPPTTTFADPSSLNAINFTSSLNANDFTNSSSPSDDEHLEILPPPPSHPAVQDLRADGMRNQNTIDLADVDDSEEVSVPPPVINPDPVPDAETDPSSIVTNDTQTENSGNDIKSTRNNAGGRYNLRNLLRTQYAQIQKRRKNAHFLFVTRLKILR